MGAVDFHRPNQLLTGGGGGVRREEGNGDGDAVVEGFRALLKPEGVVVFEDPYLGATAERSVTLRLGGSFSRIQQHLCTLPAWPA